MLKFLYAGCLALSPVISAQFTLEMCSGRSLINRKQESPANAKGTHDSSKCMKAHCEQM